MQTPEEILLSAWRQTLVESRKIISLADDTFTVRSTAKSKLKQVDFEFEGRQLRGLEQNPSTNFRWAGMARNRPKVMQFLEHGKYIGIVADEKLHLY
jgi:hypothetical protein